MPPFTLPALETAIAKRLAIPAYEVRTVADEIYARYETSGPSGARWQSRRVTHAWTGRAGYDVCRGEQREGVYFSEDEATVQALADALNELERPPA